MNKLRLREMKEIMTEGDSAPHCWPQFHVFSFRLTLLAHTSWKFLIWLRDWKKYRKILNINCIRMKFQAVPSWASYMPDFVGLFCWYLQLLLLKPWSLILPLFLPQTETLPSSSNSWPGFSFLSFQNQDRNIGAENSSYNIFSSYEFSQHG